MAMESFDSQTVKTLADLGAKSAGALAPISLTPPSDAVGLPASVPAMLRTGAAPELISVRGELERWRVAPERRMGNAKVTTLQSFEDLVNRHKDDDSAIFAQTAWPSPALTAIIDYHQADHTARFGKHRVTYDFPLTDEFKAWIAMNDKAMPQSDFAAFLEDHAAELAAPFDSERTEYEALFKERLATPAELIDLSRSLEVFVNAKAKRGERLQSGERVVEFTTEHMNGKGEKIDVPGVFMVSVPAFVDGDPLRIPARLRYRVTGGDIVWFYALYRWEFWLRAQVQADLAHAAKATELPAYEGAPEV